MNNRTDRNKARALERARLHGKICDVFVAVPLYGGG